MPQMAPMYWMPLQIFTLSLMLAMILLMYFLKPLSPPLLASPNSYHFHDWNWMW